MAIDPEHLILAHNLKNERQAIPVLITAAVEDKRIDLEDFVDEGIKELEISLNFSSRYFKMRKQFSISKSNNCLKHDSMQKKVKL